MASKNARTKSSSQIHYCKCGGVIKMKTAVLSHRLRHFAECESCGKIARRPKELMNNA